MEHIFSCSEYTEVVAPLFQCFNTTIEDVTPAKLLSLDINVTEAMELPVVWLLSTSLSQVWEARKSGKKIEFEAFKSELLARISLLKKTKWKHFTLHNSALLLDDMVNLHLN